MKKKILYEHEGLKIHFRWTSTYVRCKPKHMKSHLAISACGVGQHRGQGGCCMTWKLDFLFLFSSMWYLTYSQEHNGKIKTSNFPSNLRSTTLPMPQPYLWASLHCISCFPTWLGYYLEVYGLYSLAFSFLFESFHRPCLLWRFPNFHDTESLVIKHLGHNSWQ